MTSKRDLKKDIKTLTETVISDAIQLGDALEDTKDQKKVLDIISDMVDTHNDLLSRVSNPDGKDNTKLVKKHYNKIGDDLLKACDKAYEKLAKLAKKGE